MKTFKYFAAFLAAAFMFSACEQADELNQQNKGKEKPAVTLTQKVANDVTLTFEIKASENAAQYAYAVFAGSDNAVPSAYDIVVDETLADASGAFNTSVAEDDANTQTVTVDCSKFPAKAYQVFAAAITETGLIGEVATLNVTMNDTMIPQPAGAETDGNTVTLSFDEAVKRGTGKAYVTVLAWYAEDENDFVRIANQLIAEEDIVIEANTVTITCPEAGAGAGYILSFQKGLVTDLSGNPCEECKSGLDEDYNYVGIGWDTENVDIPITASCFEEPAEDTNWLAEGASLSFVLPTEVMVNDRVKNPVSVIYKEAEGVSNLYAEWSLGADSKTVTVVLPKAPTGEFDVCVAAGLFYDIWGNFTTAFEPDELRYSNYLVDIKPGYYLVDYEYEGEEGIVASKFLSLFEKVDNTTYLMSADWFELMKGEALALPSQLVGTVDFAKSTITFDGTWLYKGTPYSRSAYGLGFYDANPDGTMGFVFYGGGNGADPIVVKFDEDGYMTEISYCEYGIYDYVNESYMFAYGYCPDGSALTYIPDEEESQVTVNAKAPSKTYELNIRRANTK